MFELSGLCGTPWSVGVLTWAHCIKSSMGVFIDYYISFIEFSIGLWWWTSV